MSRNSIALLGSILIAASGGWKNCGAEGLANLAGFVYRFDPDSGSVTKLFESEPVLAGAAFSFLVEVPPDHPFDDADADGVADVIDVCPDQHDPEQRDVDGDGIGDACNSDIDLDGFADGLDLCPEVFDPLQLDVDRDGIGDACDPFPEDSNNEAAFLRIELAETEENLRVCLDALPIDDDEDGVDDRQDLCPGTPLAPVDAAGCSLEQFCALFQPAGRSEDARSCALADWQGDEADEDPRDCQPQRRLCIPADNGR